MAYGSYRLPSVVKPPKTGDIEKMSQYDRDFAYGTGGGLMNEEAEEIERQNRETESAYARANEEYEDILGGSGGMTEEQMARMGMYDDFLSNSLPTEQDIDSQNLDDWQKQLIMGDVTAGQEYFKPDVERDIIAESAGLTRAAIDPAKLGLSGDYASGRKQSFEQLKADLEGTNYTQAQKDAIITKAARDMGAVYEADADEVERLSLASGADPMGLAVMKGRMRDRSALQAGDAMTDARIGVDEADRNRRYDIARTVNDAYGDYADTVEGMRLGAERDISDRTLSNEARIGDQRLNQQIDSSMRGYQIQRQIDQDRSDRALTLAQEEREGGRSAYEMKNKGVLDAYDRYQGQQNQIVDYQQGNTREARDYLQQNIDRRTAEKQAAADRRLKTFDSTNNAAGEAASRYSQYKANKQPGFWSRAGTAAIGAASKWALGKWG